MHSERVGEGAKYFDAFGLPCAVYVQFVAYLLCRCVGMKAPWLTADQCRDHEVADDDDDDDDDSDRSQDHCDIIAAVRRGDFPSMIRALANGFWDIDTIVYGSFQESDDNDDGAKIWNGHAYSTALHEAAASGNVVMVQALVTAGATFPTNVSLAAAASFSLLEYIESVH
jgi:hypothetical protein